MHSRPETLIVVIFLNNPEWLDKSGIVPVVHSNDNTQNYIVNLKVSVNEVNDGSDQYLLMLMLYSTAIRMTSAH